MPNNFTNKRVKYDAAFRAKAFRLANQSHAGAAAARTLGIWVKLLYAWRKAAQTPAAAAAAILDPTAAAELRQLRATSPRQAQEPEVLKKAIVIFSTPPLL